MVYTDCTELNVEDKVLETFSRRCKLRVLTHLLIPQEVSCPTELVITVALSTQQSNDI